MMRMATVVAIVLSAAGCTAASSWMKYSAPTAPPAPDVAKVIVYRTPAYAGHKSAWEVWDGDRLAGVSENGGYFEYLCPPGTHLFHLMAGAFLSGDAAVEADLAGGKTYFLRAHVGVGLEKSPTTTADERRKRDDEFGRCDCRELRPNKVAALSETDRENARKKVAELKGAKASQVVKMTREEGE